VIIGGILFDDCGNDLGLDDFCYFGKAFCPSLDIILRPLEFLPQESRELGYDSRRDEEGVGSSEPMVPKHFQLSFGVYEDRNVDVCIKNNPKPSFW
jgi:hypothetical protein